jgi:predicted ATP-grasp superfamily ATP-dependent carboligase
MFGEFPVTDEYPLIQEYVEGCGVGLSVIMHEGMPIQLFQHRRIREFPPSGGVSVFCESVLLEPDLVEKSVSLLRAMNWEGVAMVEYRRDFHSKRTVLMEVNGRFWGSLPLAIHAGADFPYVLYSCWNEDSPPPAGGYQIGVRCRAVTGDTKWLVSVLKNYSERRIRAIGAYLSAFQPRTRYFAWSSDDPVPAIMNFFLRLRRLCARLGGAWMRRRKGGAGNGCGGIERAN